VTSISPTLVSVSRLQDRTRRVVLSLLAHPVVHRLKGIQQLGFASKVFRGADHDRWEHTLLTLDAACRLFENAPSVPAEIQEHVLAVLILQDIGHSPFSNSLTTVFNATWVDATVARLSGEDTARAIPIVRNMERNEQLISRLGLVPEVLEELLMGRWPWPSHQWVQSLHSGPLDADRLAYVPQDSIRALGKDLSKEIAKVVSSLRPDGPGRANVISVEGVDSAEAVIRARGNLLLEVYHHPVKLGWEIVIKSLLLEAWRRESEPGNRAPQSVDEFMALQDSDVETILERAANRSEILKEALTLLKSGEIVVGEIEESRPPRLPFRRIDELIDTIELDRFPSEPLWIAKSTELDPVTIYEPGSILVQDKDHFIPLEKVVPTFSRMRKAFHRPIGIASSSQLQRLISALSDRDLGFGRLQPLSDPQ
jgi:HD superfamily phosphohydrolase